MLSIVFGVASNNPDSVPSVGRVDGDSWNNKRLDFVTFTFQVRAHLLEYHAVVPSNEATHVFSDDPCRFDVSYNRKHFRPLVAVIARASSSSGVAEWLAGEAAGDNGHIFVFVAPFSITEPILSLGFLCEVSFESIAFGVGNKVCDVAIVGSVRPVLFEDGGWE
jgi:hypothetical protein